MDDARFIRWCAAKGETVTCEEWFARADVQKRLEEIAVKLEKKP